MTVGNHEHEEHLTRRQGSMIKGNNSLRSKILTLPLVKRNDSFAALVIWQIEQFVTMWRNQDFSANYPLGFFEHFRLTFGIKPPGVLDNELPSF